MAELAQTTQVLTFQDAERLAAYHQGLTGSGKPERIIEAFAPDVIVRFAPCGKWGWTIRLSVAANFSNQ